MLRTVNKKAIRIFAYLFLLINVLGVPQIIMSNYLDREWLIGYAYLPASPFDVEMIPLYVGLFNSFLMSVSSVLLLKNFKIKYLTIFFTAITLSWCSYLFSQFSAYHYKYILNTLRFELIILSLLYAIPLCLIVIELKKTSANKLQA